ncbi:MAG: glycerol-3-phosphate acyltransferase [Chloroflexi bacterium]|nr:glycerol-3-phosphate acyltransferase [Chloroflexota bacterium]
MVIQFILLLLGAYLLGSVPTAYLVARWTRGIDIRQYGSGNIGASNVSAVVSKRWSIPVTIFDLIKGMVMVLVAQWLGLNIYQQIAIGLAAIIGHNWTVFLGFNGGRGIFTTLGVILVLSPKLGVAALVLSYLFAPFHQLSLGVTLTLISLPIASWFLSQLFGIEERLPIALGYLAILLIAMLRRFTIPRTAISASVPTGELIINRLLFDRDIRDRKAWISRSPADASPLQHPAKPEKKPGSKTSR